MCRKRLATVVVIIFLIAVANVFFGISRIELTSMEPTLYNNDWVLFFRFSTPVRFGIFFIDHPKDEKLKFVKRIVGLPNEKIKIGNEIYLVPKDHYFVLGDNPEEVNSIDSRYFGPILRSNVNERVVFVFWPFSHARWLW